MCNLKNLSSFGSNLSSLKTIREIIKWTIVLGSLLMTLHCGFLILGISLALFNFIFGISVVGYIVLMLSTFLLGFCNNIRYLLTYVLGVRCCVSYQLYFGFGVWLTPLRWIMFAIGTFLLTKLLINTYNEGKTTVDNL